MTPRLILASSSPRRRDLLAQIGVVPDDIRSPDIDENPRKSELPRPYAERMAAEKALAVSRAEGEVVLAGDTTVAVGRRILPQAESEADVARFLRLLSGRRSASKASPARKSPPTPPAAKGSARRAATRSRAARRG